MTLNLIIGSLINCLTSSHNLGNSQSIKLIQNTKYFVLWLFSSIICTMPANIKLSFSSTHHSQTRDYLPGTWFRCKARRRLLRGWPSSWPSSRWTARTWAAESCSTASCPRRSWAEIVRLEAETQNMVSTINELTRILNTRIQFINSTIRTPDQLK